MNSIIILLSSDRVVRVHCYFIVYHSYPEKDVVLESCMFNPDTISDALRNSGHDTSSLVSPFMPQNVIGFGECLLVLLVVVDFSCFA